MSRLAYKVEADINSEEKHTVLSVKPAALVFAKWNLQETICHISYCNL